jgi:hypothetical protein
MMLRRAGLGSHKVSRKGGSKKRSTVSTGVN